MEQPHNPPPDSSDSDPLWGEDPTFRNGGAPPPPPRNPGLDLSAFFVLLDAMRRAAPPELQERVTSLIREVLLTLRSLIDWYLDRLEQPRRQARVEDIPID